MTPEKDQAEIDSLEGTSTVIESSASSAIPVTPAEPSSPAPSGTPATTEPAKTPKKPKKIGSGRLRSLLAHTNIYFLSFVLLIVSAIAVFVIALLHSKTQTLSPISSSSLSQSALSQLSTSDETVGDSKQVLNVQSNAVFAGQVLVRSDLQVAGKLQIGGSLSLSGITVAGNSVFDQVQVSKNLSVAGDTALQGQLTIQKSLNVNGGGTFNGPVSATQITATTLQLNGDLILTHHITAGGVTPSRTNGNNLGNGGTASISGSDTTGSITVNTGSNPGAGCFITVTFASPYNATPHVIVTPIGSGAAGIGYYVNRTTTNFTVCSTIAPGAGQTFGFDYWVVD